MYRVGQPFLFCCDGAFPSDVSFPPSALLETCTVATRTLRIFLAKPLYTSEWVDERLRHAVVHARESYRHYYGSLELVDEFDERGVVYVAEITYPWPRAGTSPVWLREWVTLRFVPGETDPPSLEDLELFALSGTPLVSVLKGDFLHHRDVLTRLVSLSRFAATPPHPLVGDMDAFDISEIRSGAVSAAFVAINEVFWRTYGSNFSVLSGVFRNELFHRLARSTKGLEAWGRAFPLAEDFLQCGACDVRLIRPGITYDYPGYFLCIPELLALLVDLIRSDHLDLQTLQEFVPAATLDSLMAWQKDHPYEVLPLIRGMGRFLAHEGVLPRSALTGDLVRQLVDRRVADGPRLRLGHASAWRQLMGRAARSLFTPSYVH